MAKEVINSTAVCNQLELVCSDPLQSEVETRKSGKGEKLEIFSCQRKINWLNLPLSTKLSSRHILCFPASHAGCRKEWFGVFPFSLIKILIFQITCLLQKPREGNRESSWFGTEAAGNHLLENMHAHTSSFFIHVKKTFTATGTFSWHVLWLVSWAKRVRESTCSLSLNMVVKSWVLSRKTWLKQ